MKLLHNIKNWIKDDDGLAGIEAALIFPLLLVIIVGVFDVGNGILANQKTLRASQITADLITRERTVNIASINEAYLAGRIALDPFSNIAYGVDIISIGFDDSGDSSILWRETINMNAVADILTIADGLSDPNSGVVIVISNYNYVPSFSGFVIDDLSFSEMAFAKGRKSAQVTME